MFCTIQSNGEICISILIVAPIVVVLCLVSDIQWFVSFLVLQSPCWGWNIWLITINCFSDVLWMFVFSGSSSRCHVLVCSVWVWYFLIIATYFLSIIGTYSILLYAAFPLSRWLIVALIPNLEDRRGNHVDCRTFLRQTKKFLRSTR